MAIVKNEIDKILQAATTRSSNDPGAAVRLNSSATIFKITDAGSDPASINFTAVLNSLEGSIVFSITGGTLTSITATGATLTYANMGADVATVTATVTSNGQTYTASSVVAKVRDGVAGTNGVPGLNNAVVNAYQRSATAPVGTPGTVTYDFTSKTITTAALLNGWLKTIPAGTDPLYVTAATASSTAATDSIDTAEWSGAVVLAQNGGTGGAGAAGLNSAPVLIYQRNNTGTAPALPTADTVYTFSTGGLTGLTSGWSKAVPAASGGKYLFVTTATAANTTATDTIPAAEWAAVQLLAQDGAIGADGLNTATVYAYQRATTAPTLKPGAITWDFASASITTPATLANFWQKTLPAGTDPLYVVLATARASTATDTIADTEWSGVVLLAASGAAGSAGSTGAAGLNSATVSIYQRSASATAPALPSLTTTYTFSSGGLTNLNNGWTRTIPTAGGQYLHTTQATAAATTATDDIPATEWAAVQLMYDAADLIAAKAAADAANLRLANMAADGKLTKEEKAQVVLDFKYAGVGFDDLVAKAGAVGVSSTAYSNAKVALNTYLEPIIGVGFNDVSYDSDIVRQTFIDKFAAVYSEKQLLINAIAAKAQADANTANSAITNISSDNVLSKGEKPLFMQTWDAIVGEVNPLLTQADNLAVSRVAYLNAYNALNAVIPVGWNDLTTDTTINGLDIRTKFTTYYTEKQALINALAAKAATKADWTGVTGPAKAADNATVGATWGVNIDGTGKPSDNATNDLPLSQFGVTINGNTLTKTGGTANLWDAAANGSGTGSPAAFVSMVPANYAYMAVGLSTAPGTSNSWEQLNYGIEFIPDGNLYYMESGSAGQILVNGVAVTYAPNADTFTVEHDGRNAVYRKNGVVIRSTPSVTTAPLFFDSSFYTSGASVKNVRFVPLSSVALPSFSASGSNTLATSKPNSAIEVAIGTATLIPSGGKLPITYQWSVTGINFDPDGRTGAISLANTTSAQVNVSAACANDTRILGYLIGVATDAEKRSDTVQFPISCQFGTPT